ncbi:SAF domain-containing protein [Marinicrinis lubricantis]|uniref:SAF domain-containing protein n=1 Tax=Marinicrinis lubricantis TaxID=2086470 RepID=A0ABW1IJF0_9BACL
MSKKQHLVIALFAAFVAIGMAYLLYWFQIRHVALQETVQVVVPTQFIDSSTVLDESMLEYKPIEVSSFEKGMVSSMDEVLGMENWIPLGKGEPLLAWKMNRLHLYPLHHQSTFQIPKEYVLSVFNGIRAGDRVIIYSSSPGGESKRLFEQPVTVASVRTSANVEVDDSEHSLASSIAEGNEQQLYVSRMTPNGSIEYINLNLTEEQWLAIDNLCKDESSKLVIAYQSSFTDQGMKEADSE